MYALYVGMASAACGGRVMDNLSATAIAAQRAGMSYGKYVALHGIRCSEPIVVDVPTKICPECGKEFPIAGRRWNTIYCDPECQILHGQRLALQRYYERKKAKEIE